MDYTFLLSLLFYTVPMLLLFYMAVEIYLRGRSIQNRLSAALFFTMLIMLTGNFFTSMFPVEEVETLTVWLKFALCFLLFGLVPHFVLRLTGRFNHWSRERVLLFCYTPTLCFPLLLWPSDRIYIDVAVKGNWQYGIPSPVFFAIVAVPSLYSLVCSLYALIAGYRHAKRLNHEKKIKQMQTILRSSVIGGTLSIVLAYFNPYWVISDEISHPEASFAGLLYFAVMIRYVMIKHEFLPSVERKYRILFEKSPCAILLASETGRIMEANPAAEALFRIPRPFLKSKTPNELLQPYSARYGHQTAREELQITSLEGGEKRIVKVEKERIESGGETYEYLLLWDVTDTVVAEENHAYLAFHDPLTGLGNRRKFQEKAEKLNAQATGGQGVLAVILLDLDRFKDVNDNLGHHAGDFLLQYASTVLRECCPEAELIARIGGDEFVLVFSGVERQDDLAAIGEAILDRFARPFVWNQERVYATASLGISMNLENREPLEILLQHADIAMYESKRNGRNRYSFFSARQRNSRERRLSLEARLREAVQERRFSLYLQPQFDLQTNRLCGVEALLRWKEPDGTIVLPGDFIPLAEETGLIVPLGNWVLREACRWGRDWLDRGFPPLTVSVNVSSGELVNPKWLSEVEAALRDTGFPGRLLHLEMTESMIVSNEPYFQQIFASLMEMGIRLAIDDFGTGYSTFSVIQAIPFDIFKIDRSIVEGIDRSEKSRNVVKALIAMARSLDQRVIAEGVESPEQAEILKAFDCDAVQGFLYGKPMPAEEFAEWYLRSRDPGAAGDKETA